MSKTTFQITQEQTDFIRSWSTIVTLPSGEVYYYIPTWFNIRAGGKSNIVDAYSFEHMPEDLKYHLSESRDEWKPVEMLSPTVEPMMINGGMTFPRGLREVYKSKAKGHPQEKLILCILSLIPTIIEFDNEAHTEAMSLLPQILGKIDFSDFDRVDPLRVPDLKLNIESDAIPEWMQKHADKLSEEIRGKEDNKF